MVKLIGALLIASSLLSLVLGTFIDLRYGNHSEITGNAITNILAQKPISANFFDYSAGIAFSYSIASFMIGIVLLFRV